MTSMSGGQRVFVVHHFDEIFSSQSFVKRNFSLKVCYHVEYNLNPASNFIVTLIMNHYTLNFYVGGWQSFFLAHPSAPLKKLVPAPSINQSITYIQLAPGKLLFYRKVTPKN